MTDPALETLEADETAFAVQTRLDFNTRLTRVEEYRKHHDADHDKNVATHLDIANLKNWALAGLIAMILTIIVAVSALIVRFV